MGSGKIFECPECGNRVELYEGIGMMWSHFDTSMFYPPKKDSCGLNFYDETDKNIIKEAQKFIEESENAYVADAYEQSYICEKCGGFTTKLYFRIESE
jgi:transcription initiation factor IIE alpha subunit